MFDFKTGGCFFGCLATYFFLKSAISRQAKVNKFSLVFWLNEIVLKSAISRQAKVNKFSLVFWLNEIVTILAEVRPLLTLT